MDPCEALETQRLHLMMLWSKDGRLLLSYHPFPTKLSHFQSLRIPGTGSMPSLQTPTLQKAALRGVGPRDRTLRAIGTQRAWGSPHNLLW